MTPLPIEPIWEGIVRSRATTCESEFTESIQTGFLNHRGCRFHVPAYAASLSDRRLDRSAWQHGPLPLGEIGRLRHASSSNRAACTGIPQSEMTIRETTTRRRSSFEPVLAVESANPSGHRFGAVNHG